MEPEDLLPIGEISRRTGVAHSALRYYESLGLITSTRTPGGTRRYPRHMMRRVSLLTVAKRLGIPLTEAGDALELLPPDRQPTPHDWHRVSRRWRALLAERREHLTRLEQELNGCIGCGCLSMKSCFLFNPDDVLGEQGPGAHRV